VASDTPCHVLAALGVRRDPLTGAWRGHRAPRPGPRRPRRAGPRHRCLAGRPAATPTNHPAATANPAARRAVAVDGKTLRGSGHHGTAQVHLLAVMDHTSRGVLGQADVDHATNEIARFRPLLDRLDLADTVVTADALHTQREHADWLVTQKHAADLLIVKGNQSRLHRQLATSPGQTSLSQTTPATAATTAWRPAACRSPPSLGWTYPTPPRPCGSPAGSGRLPAAAGAPYGWTR
jgi:Transposase DDE domain